MGRDKHWGWLSIPVFLAFASERGLSLVCSQCKPQKQRPLRFTFDTGDDPEGYIPRSTNYTSTEAGLVDTRKSRHIPCVRLTCTNCGHVSLYSMYVIKQWRDAKEPAKGKAEAKNG